MNYVESLTSDVTAHQAIHELRKAGHDACEYDSPDVNPSHTKFSVLDGIETLLTPTPERLLVVDGHIVATSTDVCLMTGIAFYSGSDVLDFLGY